LARGAAALLKRISIDVDITFITEFKDYKVRREVKRYLEVKIWNSNNKTKKNLK
jgi:hypothetical protein